MAKGAYKSSSGYLIENMSGKILMMTVIATSGTEGYVSVLENGGSSGTEIYRVPCIIGAEQSARQIEFRPDCLEFNADCYLTLSNAAVSVLFSG